MWEIQTWKHLTHSTLGHKGWVIVLAKENPGIFPRILSRWNKKKGTFSWKTDTLWGVLSTEAGAMPSLSGICRWGRQRALTALCGSVSSPLLWITCAGANGKGLEKQPGLRALWAPAEEVFCAQRTHSKSKLLLLSATDIWCLWQRQNEMAGKNTISTPKSMTVMLNIDKKCFSAAYYRKHDVWPLYSFAGTALTKNHKPGSLKMEIDFLPVLKARSSRSRFWQVDSFWGLWENTCFVTLFHGLVVCRIVVISRFHLSSCPYWHPPRMCVSAQIPPPLFL